MLSFWMQQRLIFPDRRQSSIVSADELNFCVRYENRWDLIANVTAIEMTPDVFESSCEVSYVWSIAPKK